LYLEIASKPDGMAIRDHESWKMSTSLHRLYYFTAPVLLMVVWWTVTKYGNLKAGTPFECSTWDYHELNLNGMDK
jgi:hypothetical protein